MGEGEGDVDAELDGEGEWRRIGRGCPFGSSIARVCLASRAAESSGMGASS
jgi:hypothetical protein